MPIRFYLFFVAITGLLMFYPGASRFFTVFAHQSQSFSQETQVSIPTIEPIPVVSGATSPVISAQGAYVVDLNTFTPVFGRNEHDEFLPASTTKVMTALVARDLYELDEVVTIERVNAVGQVMGLRQNEQITVENLLYGSLVQSGNDAARALADYYGYDQYLEKMNAKAQDLGMRNSRFQTPSGLDAQNQYTSPFDLALAGRALLNDPILKKMVGTKQITVSDIDYTIFHPLTNVNQLLGDIPGLGGLKTGYTEAAGENLISFYQRPDGSQFLIVVLKSEDRFADTRSIVTWLRTSVSFTDLPLADQN